MRRLYGVCSVSVSSLVFLVLCAVRGVRGNLNSTECWNTTSEYRELRSDGGVVFSIPVGVRSLCAPFVLGSHSRLEIRPSNETASRDDTVIECFDVAFLIVGSNVSVEVSGVTIRGCREFLLNGKAPDNSHFFDLAVRFDNVHLTDMSREGRFALVIFDGVTFDFSITNSRISNFPKGAFIWADGVGRVLLQDIVFEDIQADLVGGVCLCALQAYFEVRRCTFNRISGPNNPDFALFFHMSPRNDDLSISSLVEDSSFRQVTGGNILATEWLGYSIVRNVSIENASLLRGFTTVGFGMLEVSGLTVTGLHSGFAGFFNLADTAFVTVTNSTVSFEGSSPSGSYAASLIGEAQLFVVNSRFSAKSWIGDDTPSVGAVGVTDLAYASFEDCTFEALRGEVGGAIYVRGYARVDAVGCSFMQCSARAASGLNFASRGSGGAIKATEHSTVDVRGSEFVECFAQAGGGAIAVNRNANVTLHRISASACSSTSDGGFAMVEGGAMLSISSSSVTNSTARRFGGAFVLYHNCAFLALELSISGCLAIDALESGGGAVAAFGYDELAMERCTMSNNRAATGGAVFTGDGELDEATAFRDSSFSFNSVPKSSSFIGGENVSSFPRSIAVAFDPAEGPETQLRAGFQVMSGSSLPFPLVLVLVDIYGNVVPPPPSRAYVLRAEVLSLNGTKANAEVVGDARGPVFGVYATLDDVRIFGAAGDYQLVVRNDLELPSEPQSLNDLFLTFSIRPCVAPLALVDTESSEFPVCALPECRQGDTCVNGVCVDSKTCACDDGFTGVRCEVEEDRLRTAEIVIVTVVVCVLLLLVILSVRFRLVLARNLSRNLNNVLVAHRSTLVVQNMGLLASVGFDIACLALGINVVSSLPLTNCRNVPSHCGFVQLIVIQALFTLVSLTFAIALVRAINREALVCQEWLRTHEGLSGASLDLRAANAFAKRLSREDLCYVSWWSFVRTAWSAAEGVFVILPFFVLGIRHLLENPDSQGLYFTATLVFYALILGHKLMATPRSVEAFLSQKSKARVSSTGRFRSSIT